MHKILELNGKSIISKYNNYYIRFIGGQHTELPCDIQITVEEKDIIVKKPEEMRNIFNSYKEKLTWTMENFIIKGLKDAMFYEGIYTNDEIEEYLGLLSEHENIKYEMYESVMIENFPLASAIEVKGYTAEEIAKTKKCSICDAYIELLKIV